MSAIAKANLPFRGAPRKQNPISNATAGATYKYDPFGRLVSSSGSLASANGYRFSSKEWIQTAGIYYYGYRFYDPLTQRWLNRDPIAERGGINIYTYISNNSINVVDMFGLDGWLCVSPNCSGCDLSKWTYLAGKEPPSPEDVRAGIKEGRKVARALPKPGGTVEADAIYYPGGALKINNFGTATVTCGTNGLPQLSYGGLGSGLIGGGGIWPVGQTNHPYRWPDSTIQPYPNGPPGTPLPAQPMPPPPQPIRTGYWFMKRSKQFWLLIGMLFVCALILNKMLVLCPVFNTEYANERAQRLWGNSVQGRSLKSIFSDYGEPIYMDANQDINGVNILLNRVYHPPLEFVQGVLRTNGVKVFLYYSSPKNPNHSARRILLICQDDVVQFHRAKDFSDWIQFKDFRGAPRKQIPAMRAVNSLFRYN